MKKEKGVPYPELPRGWTIIRLSGEVTDWFYAYNYNDGRRRPAQPTYDAALNELKKWLQ